MTKEGPGTLVNQWTSTKGAKGTTVVVLMIVGPLMALVLGWAWVANIVRLYVMYREFY